MKNAVFNKFYSYFIGMVAVLSCVFSMPIFSHAATSDPFELVEPPYNIGVPINQNVITQEMIDIVVEGFQPYITDDNWIIVVNEINASYDVVYFYLYNNPETFNLSKNDFLNGSSYRFDATFSSGREVGYVTFDLSDYRFGYASGYAKTFNINTLNSSSNGYVVASSDNFVLSGSNPTWIIFQKLSSDDSEDDYIPQIIDFFPKDTTDYGNDLLNFLRDIKNAIFSIGNVIYTGIKYIIDSIKNTIAKVLELIKDSIDAIKDFVSDIKDMVSIIANGISTIFNAIIDLGTENGSFTITTLVRRLIIPDDLSVFRSNLNGLMETLQNTYGTEIIGYLNQLKNLFNASSTNLVPEFIVPAFSIGGAQIPETVISFSIFVPFMPYLHSVMSAFMWLAFILFIIKDFPNFLSGFFSTADHEISAEHNVEYYRNHGGF